MTVARLRRPAAFARAALLIAAALALTGCAGLRVESPPPTTPPADALEQARQRQAETAAEIASTADAAATTAADPVGPVLRVVAAAATAQLDALGGVWEPYPGETPTDAPAPTGAAEPGAGEQGAGEPTEPTAAEPTQPQDVVDLLTAGAAEALDDAATVDDGRLARLLASIGLHRELAADQLAAAAGLPAPAPAPAVAPTGVPAGLSTEALGPVIVSLDALGAAWEVVAARSSEAARADAAARAAAARSDAEAWARAAGVSGTATDPRAVGYALPAEVLDPTTDPLARAQVLARLHTELGATWLELVAGAGPGERAALISAARTALRSGTGDVAPAFPGLPELG